MRNEDQVWLDYRVRFADVYDEFNYASPLQSAMMRANHRLTEKRFQKHDQFPKVLEIGVGIGVHSSFVRLGFDQYVLSDLDAKTLEAAKGKLNDKFGNKLMFETQSGVGLAYADNSFDRLIATHVLELIYQSHLVLQEWRRVVINGGVLSMFIPTDPGLAWRLGRYLSRRKNEISQGIAYGYAMAREGVNSYNNLIVLLRHNFAKRTESWWPFPIPTIDLPSFFVCHTVFKKVEH